MSYLGVTDFKAEFINSCSLVCLLANVFFEKERGGGRQKDFGFKHFYRVQSPNE